MKLMNAYAESLTIPGQGLKQGEAGNYNVRRKGCNMKNKQLSDEFSKVKEQIRKKYQVSDISYNTWILDVTVGAWHQNSVCLYIPSNNPLMLPFYEQKYKKMFEETISEYLGHQVNVIFSLLPENKKEQNTEKAEEKVEPAKENNDIVHNFDAGHVVINLYLNGNLPADKYVINRRKETPLPGVTINIFGDT